MAGNDSRNAKAFLVKYRWGLVPLVTGILIVGLVAATEGEYGAWTLWLAIPMLMIGLLYILVASAIPIFFGSPGPGEDEQSEDTSERKEPK